MPWGRLLGFDADVGFGDDETVVYPALSTAHSLGDTNVLPVPLPDDDIDNDSIM